MRAREQLSSLPRFGDGPGLHRMVSLCAHELEDPWLGSANAIRVTGSNGKGSVCAIATSLLEAFGLRAATYTSPHLVELNERLVIGGRKISDAQLEAALSTALARAKSYQERHPGDRIARFEALTTAAIIHLSQARPEAMVIEAGIGGRLDSTRVIPGRLVGLTNVDLEHTSILGASRELIAIDKADICPDGGTVIFGSLDTGLQRRLAGHLSVRGVELVAAAQLCQLDRVRYGRGGSSFDLRLADQGPASAWTRDVELPLLGSHQVENARLATALVTSWLAEAVPERLDEQTGERIKDGLRAVRCPGRLEQIHQEPEIWIDLGHTPDAISRLTEAVQTHLQDRRILLVTGASEDKQVETIVSRLVMIADEVICTSAHHRGCPAERVHDVCREVRPDLAASLVADIGGALRAAIQTAAANDMTILVAGGLFLAIEARHAAAGLDPRELQLS